MLKAVKQLILATHLQTPGLYSVDCLRSSCFSAKGWRERGRGQYPYGFGKPRLNLSEDAPDIPDSDQLQLPLIGQ